jgi:hypothetical protein
MWVFKAVLKRGLDSDVTILSKIIDIHYYRLSFSEPVPHITAIIMVLLPSLKTLFPE